MIDAGEPEVVANTLLPPYEERFVTDVFAFPEKPGKGAVRHTLLANKAISKQAPAFIQAPDREESQSQVPVGHIHFWLDVEGYLVGFESVFRLPDGL